ncbi:MAG: hypothetical protein V4625_12095 [Pseudomonadota bacterium]
MSEQFDATATDENPSGWLRTFFWRHWNGELRLPISYWLVGLVLQFALLFAVLFFFLFLIGITGIRLPLVFLMVVVLGAVAVWSNVGVWRSATVYMRSSPRLWGMLAKAGVVCNAVQIVLELGSLLVRT